MPRQKQTQALLIRPIKPKRDRKALVCVAKGLPEWFDHEDIDEIEEDLLGDDGFVAEWERQRVGCVTIGIPAEVPASQRAEITWLFVERGMHGKGVGKALLAAAEAFVLQNLGEGAELMVWTLADEAEPACYASTRAFYRGQGFQDWYVDRSDLQIWKYPRLFMKKML